jgi:sortase A
VRWIRRSLLLIAFVALSYVAESAIDSEVYQFRLRRAFDEQQEKLPAGTIGKIAIPRIGLSAMIAEGTEWATLRRAIGHVPGTAFPGETGNAAIAAHRDTFFRGLRNLSRGDDIDVTTDRGLFHYVVESTEIVKPNDVSVLKPGKSPELTLITCYPFFWIGPAPKRFIVHARVDANAG